MTTASRSRTAALVFALAVSTGCGWDPSIFGLGEPGAPTWARVSTITDPFRTLSYDYDDDGRLQRASIDGTAVLDLTYDGDFPIALSYGEDLVYAFTYEQGRLVERRREGPGEIEGWVADVTTYRYGDGGLLVGLERVLGEGEDAVSAESVYVYDDAGLLVEQTVESITSGRTDVVTLTYDLLGQLRSLEGLSSSPYSEDYDVEYTSTLAYEDGRLTESDRGDEGVFTYRYNDDGLLDQIGHTQQGTTTVTYEDGPVVGLPLSLINSNPLFDHAGRCLGYADAESFTVHAAY